MPKRKLPKIVNLTPHPINIYSPEGKLLATFPPSGEVARVSTSEKVVGNLPNANIPLVINKYGQVVGLPSTPQPNHYYVVSILVAQAVTSSPQLYQKFKGRLLVPNTAPTPLGAVRDKEGKIIGVKSFIIY